jgi:hypothetical protein
MHIRELGEIGYSHKDVTLVVWNYLVIRIHWCTMGIQAKYVSGSVEGIEDILAWADPSHNVNYDYHNIHWCRTRPRLLR